MNLLEPLAGASRAVTGFLVGWKLVVAAAVVSAAGAAWASHSVTAAFWRADYNELVAKHATERADNATASLEQFKGDVALIHGAALSLSSWKIGFNTDMATFSKDLHDAIKARPLPPGCTPDAGRLRSLDAAIAAANTARTARQ